MTEHEQTSHVISDTEARVISELGNMGRRKFLSMCLLTLGSLLFSMRAARAGLFYSTRKVEGIPQAWVDRMGLDVLRYANYIKGLRLRNITPYKVLYPHFKTRGRTRNCLPPRYMWRNIAATLRIIDAMSDRMRTPVNVLLSVYRSPSYNRAVRGRTRSQHLVNKAIDCTFRGVSPRTVSAVARRLRSEGLFKGGVGRYSSFTHIDTRGHNADW